MSVCRGPLAADRRRKERVGGAGCRFRSVTTWVARGATWIVMSRNLLPAGSGRPLDRRCRRPRARSTRARSDRAQQRQDVLGGGRELVAALVDVAGDDGELDLVHAIWNAVEQGVRDLVG